MCGINGVVLSSSATVQIDLDEVTKTRDHMAARGPDGSGLWLDDNQQVALAHRRLSIIDLSERGAQPMHGPRGRYHVVFNGEIYNYPSLRVHLEHLGYTFQSSSDTESLIHLYDAYGVEMVQRLRGMFAFAIWDSMKRELFIARDPYGIKPLYTSYQNGVFRFASQVKAIIAGGGLVTSPSPAGVVSFHIWGSVSEPHTLYREINALPAGFYQVVDSKGPRTPVAFGLLHENTTPVSPTRTSIEAEEIVSTAIAESVRAHMLADVEVGVFLSAGVDSSALLGIMRDNTASPIKAITLAFDEFSGTMEDEAPLASIVARAYGADHVVRTVSESEFKEDLPKILEAMDQPSIDGVNTWFVAKATHEAGLKVALSGLGGDELVAGYPSFHELPSFVERTRIVRPLSRFGPLFSILSYGAFSRLGKPKLAGILSHINSYAQVYLLRRALFLPFELSQVLDPEFIAGGLAHIQNSLKEWDAILRSQESEVTKVSLLESSFYMRNQLLRDSDWAGMAHSLEIRTPLVDFNLFKRVAPFQQVLLGKRGKEILSRVPTKPLPSEIVTRKKTGFGVPTGKWLENASKSTSKHKGLASRAWAQRVFEGFH